MKQTQPWGEGSDLQVQRNWNARFWAVKSLFTLEKTKVKSVWLETSEWWRERSEKQAEITAASQNHGKGFGGLICKMGSYWIILNMETCDLVCILKDHSGCCVQSQLLGQGHDWKQGVQGMGFSNISNKMSDRHLRLDYSGRGPTCKKWWHWPYVLKHSQKDLLLCSKCRV